MRDEHRVPSFKEKPSGDGAWVNGGYFVLDRKVLDLIDGDDTVWERGPMEQLAEQRPARGVSPRGLLAADGHAARQAPARIAVVSRQGAVEELVARAMIFTATALAGATIVDLEPREDARGYFCRTYCEREFEANGLPTRIAQTNMSLTRRAGTLRGMHYQLPPHAEDKLMRCVRGAIWDAIVDIRPGVADLLPVDRRGTERVQQPDAAGAEGIRTRFSYADRRCRGHLPGVRVLRTRGRAWCAA